MYNLNYNINPSSRGGSGCRGEVKFNYSASIVVAGGGGGGNAGNFGAGGGGGAAMAVSQSISIIPNVTYQINVGAGGAVASKGQDSYLIGFDDNDTIPISFYAGGGNPGGVQDGGNSGTGSIVRAGVTTSYSAFTGGTGELVINSFGGQKAGGGGASNAANGGNGTITPGQGGNGGSGFSAGGGGGFFGAGPTGGYGNGGSNGTGTGYGSGGGGATTRSPGGLTAGSNGVVIISYTGQPKAFVTNASTTTVDGVTTHTFASGSGTFLYTYPYPWADVVPYTVEVCPPTAQPPFAPYGRADEYSASLVLAIPGAIFKNGYNNVFNQVSEFDDISGYLKGGAVLNPNTGKYTPAYVSHTLAPTGSVGFITASTTVNQFSAQGYETSLIVSGNTALNVTPLSSSLGTDFNLSKDTPWCMEAWFAYDQTASLIPSGGVPSVTESIWYGAPNKQWIGHWFTDNPTGSSYIAYTGWSGRTDSNLIAPPPPLTLVSGSPAFYYDGENGPGNNPDYRINATTGSNIVPYVFQHTAITCYPSASVDPPITKGVVNMYINGVRVGGDIITDEIVLAPATLITILGNASPFVSDTVNAINNTNYKTGSGLFIQDMRVYNGAAKYTGSSFTPPPSMIVGIQEPYPQYQ